MASILCLLAISCVNFRETRATNASPTPQPPSSSDCSNEASPPFVSSGWKLLWQHTFDHAIARPPRVDGQQMVLIERQELGELHQKDTAWIVDPQTGSPYWKIEDAQQHPLSITQRRIDSVVVSPKYWGFSLQYYPPASEVVVDRQTGKIVYDSGAQVDASTVTISDEAIFDKHEYALMRRFDLPSGQLRWSNHWDQAWGSSGFFALDSWLYYFNGDKNVYQYDSLTGGLVLSGSFGMIPVEGDVIIKNLLAIARSEQGVGVFDLQAFAPRWYTKIDYRVAKNSNAFWGEDIPSLLVTADSVYLFDASDTLLRLDLRTGKRIWQTPSPGPQAMSRPTVAGGLVYGLFSDGTVQAFSEADGSQRGVVMRVPLWYRKETDAKDWRDLMGGIATAGDALIVTTGCRSVYAIQRDK